MKAPRLDTLNAAQRRTASRSLYIRRARLPRWAVVRIVEGGHKISTNYGDRYTSATSAAKARANVAYT